MTIEEDEFAIDFLNWALSYKWLSSETSEELLKIYKKIKGL